MPRVPRTTVTLILLRSMIAVRVAACAETVSTVPVRPYRACRNTALGCLGAVRYTPLLKESSRAAFALLTRALGKDFGASRQIVICGTSLSTFSIGSRVSSSANKPFHRTSVLSPFRCLRHPIASKLAWRSLNISRARK